MRHFTLWYLGTMLLILVMANAPETRAGDAQKPPDPKGCHFSFEPQIDDEELLGQVNRDIETNPIRAGKDSWLCIGVKKIENGYVTLVVQHGHYELAHWLVHDPTRLKKALEENTSIGSLFANKKTKDIERKLVYLLLKLANAIEKNPKVKGVFWDELEQQKAYCSICTPPKWRPLYKFYYPNVGTEEFLNMLASLHIKTAMPTKDGAMLQPAPSHTYEREVIVYPNGYRSFVYRLKFSGLPDKVANGSMPRVLPIQPGHLGYAQSQQYLRWCQLWSNSSLRQEIVHIYPEKLQQHMTAMWKAQHKRDLQYWPNLRNKQPASASFAFHKTHPQQWDIYLWKLTYSD